MNAGARVAGTGLVLALLGHAQATTAAPWVQAEDVASAAGQSSIEVTFVGSRASCDALIRAVGPVLVSGERLSCFDEDNPPSTTEDRGPRVVVTLASKGKIRVLVSESGRSILVRSIDAEDLSPVVAEIVAQIVRQTAETLRAGGANAPASPATEPPPVALSPPVSALPPERGLQARPSEPAAESLERSSLPWSIVDLELAAAYSVRATIPDTVPVNMGVERGFTTSITARLEGELLEPFISLTGGRGQVSLPGQGVNFSFPAFELSRFSLRPLIGLTSRRLAPVGLALAIGAGADFVRVSAGDTASRYMLIPSAEAMLRVALELPLWKLAIVAAASVDLQPRSDFAVSLDGSQYGSQYPYDFAWTRRVQPGAMIGLGRRL